MLHQLWSDARKEIKYMHKFRKKCATEQHSITSIIKVIHFIKLLRSERDYELNYVSKEGLAMDV